MKRKTKYDTPVYPTMKKTTDQKLSGGNKADMQKNRSIYQYKGLAIICIVFSHSVNRTSFTAVDRIMNEAVLVVGTIGVPIFAIISGLLLNRDKSARLFWKSRFFSTVICWFFWGTLVWAYEVIRKGLSYYRWDKWILGDGTYFWYMRALVVAWLVFRCCRFKHAVTVILITSLIVRIFLFDIRLIEVDSQFVKDIVALMPFFAIGAFLRERQGIMEWFSKDKPYFFNASLLLFSTVFVALTLWMKDERFNIANRFYILFQFGVMVYIGMLMRYLSQSRFLEELGKRSFLIYLLHFPFAGIMSNLFSRNRFLALFVFVHPVITLLFMYIVTGLLLEWGKKNRIIGLVTGGR